MFFRHKKEKLIPWVLLGLFVLMNFTFALPLVSLAQENGSIEDVTNNGIVPCNDAPTQGGGGCGYSALIQGIQRLLTFFIYFAGVVGVVMFTYAGWLLLFSGGNPSSLAKAKSIFTGTVIGFIVVISAWLIVSTILDFFVKDEVQEKIPISDVNSSE